MAHARLVVVAILVGTGACGSGKDAGAVRRDAGAGSGSDAPPVALGRAPLGAASLAAFDWRRRAGHAAYREAVAAETTEAWAAVVAACRRARQLDPDHLEAAWLEAAALARQGALGEVLAPLQVAAAGDWGKWGERSLDLPLFAAFRATPTGQAWSRAADAYRADYVAALARAAIVGAAGDLHAYDPTTQRWLRVTRTYGAVRAAVASDSARLVAYVAVRKTDRGRAATVGVVDLATGRPGGEVALSGERARLRWRDARGVAALEVADDKQHKAKFDRIDWGRGTRAPSDAKGALLSPTLHVDGDRARLVRLPHADVTADWDEEGVAGALRIERSRRTVTAPGTTLFDGNTLVWSRDQARLALATAPADPCAAEDREVAIIDVDTGRLRSVDRGAPIVQVSWIGDGMLAIARGGTVTLLAADGTPGATLTADAPLWLWTRPVPPCDGQPGPVPEPEPEPEPEPDLRPRSGSGSGSGSAPE